MRNTDRPDASRMAWRTYNNIPRKNRKQYTIHKYNLDENENVVLPVYGVDQENNLYFFSIFEITDRFGDRDPLYKTLCTLWTFYKFILKYFNVIFVYRYLSINDLY